jgi:hypothetical protein
MEKVKAAVRVNERGLRIGESHPNARLSDADVERLHADREAGMSLGALAQKWGISKSGVKAIVDGKRRGQIGQRVQRAASNRTKGTRVRVNLKIGLHQRAKLHRLGGGVWLEKMLDQVK